MTKSYFATTVSQGATLTTATSVTECCATIIGCNLRDIETDVEQDVCTLVQRREMATALAPEPTGADLHVSGSAAQEDEENDRQTRHQETSHLLHVRAQFPWSCESAEPMDGFVLSRYESLENDVDIIRALLQERQAGNQRTFTEIRSNAMRYTVFFVVHNFGANAAAYFDSRQVLEAFGAWVIPAAAGIPVVIPRSIGVDNDGDVSQVLSERGVQPVVDGSWQRSIMSFPAGVPFNVDIGPNVHGPSHKAYASYWEDQGVNPPKFGQGQRIYIIEDGMHTAPSFASRMQPLAVPMTNWRLRYTSDEDSNIHGVMVAQAAVGEVQGIAWGAEMTWVPTKRTYIGRETFLEALLRIGDDAATRPKDTCIINISGGWVQRNGVEEARLRLMGESLLVFSFGVHVIFLCSC